MDPSKAMLLEASARSGAHRERIRWIQGRAEDAPLLPPYGLITAGASIHWMDANIVMPRFGAVLAPGGRLAIVDSESVYAESEWRAEFIAVIKKYSPLVDHAGFDDVVRGLEATGHFEREFEHRTAPGRYEQSVDSYMAMMASTSTLSRVTLGSRARDFDREARAIFARHSVTRIEATLVAGVVWGRPH